MPVTCQPTLVRARERVWGGTPVQSTCPPLTRRPDGWRAPTRLQTSPSSPLRCTLAPSRRPPARTSPSASRTSTPPRCAPAASPAALVPHPAAGATSTRAISPATLLPRVCVPWRGAGPRGVHGLPHHRPGQGCVDYRAACLLACKPNMCMPACMHACLLACLWICLCRGWPDARPRGPQRAAVHLARDRRGGRGEDEGEWQGRDRGSDSGAAEGRRRRRSKWSRKGPTRSR